MGMGSCLQVERMRGVDDRLHFRVGEMLLEAHRARIEYASRRHHLDHVDVALQRLRRRFRGPEDEYLSAAIGAIEMLKTGCTSAYDLYMAVPAITDEAFEAVVRAYTDVGIRVVLAPAVAVVSLGMVTA